MTHSATAPPPDIDRLINEAHRYAAEHSLRISPSRVSTLVRRYLQAPNGAERRLHASPDEAQLVAYLHPRRPRRLVLVDPTGNKAARNVDAKRKSAPRYDDGGAPKNAAFDRTAVVPQPHCGRSEMLFPNDADTTPASGVVPDGTGESPL